MIVPFRWVLWGGPICELRWRWSQYQKRARCAVCRRVVRYEIAKGSDFPIENPTVFCPKHRLYSIACKHCGKLEDEHCVFEPRPPQE